MGIPSYYTYLIRNFNKLILKKSLFKKNIECFFLDSNSIIYDCIHNMESSNNFENNLIKNICLKIDSLIKDVSPTKLVYISFDGIAPVAKLKQQKERRYKSKLFLEIEKKLGIQKTSKNNFDKTQITPGTKFMCKLDKLVAEYFKNRESLYGVEKIIFSGSQQRGEGEHKIFSFIRLNKEIIKQQNVVVYGLDADLIIIGLGNIQHTKNVYLFRETPEFIRSVNADLEPNELYLMDLNYLKNIISQEMKTSNLSTNDKHKNKLIIDYVFLMIFMGNDFMPHFPSLNIRTKGLDIILKLYKINFGDKNLFLIDDNYELIWKNIRDLIFELTKIEEQNFKQEIIIRRKVSMKNTNHKVLGDDNVNKKEEFKLLNLPVVDRDLEEYIDIFSKGWEKRYYETLFSITNYSKNNKYIQNICKNYLSGLEWVMEYYLKDCKDWRWSYKYSYPPLFIDLLDYTPIWGVEFLKNNDSNISFNQQLGYVLPTSSLHFLKKEEQDKIKKYREEVIEPSIKWSFCRYIWESHVDFKNDNFNDYLSFL